MVLIAALRVLAGGFEGVAVLRFLEVERRETGEEDEDWDEDSTETSSSFTSSCMEEEEEEEEEE